MIKKFMFLIISLYLLAGCSNSETKTTITKEHNFSNIREYDVQKANLSLKRRLVIGKVKNYSRLGTQRTDGIAKDILISEFSNSQRFTILEREDLDSVMEELAFSNSLGTKSIVAKQRFLDTDYIVVASVSKYGIKITGNETLFSKTKYQTGEAVVELKVIDVLNGKVWSETGEGSSSVKFEKVLGAGNYGSINTLEEEAFRAAIIQGVEKVIAKIDSIPWSASVIKKSGNKLIINSGIENNLKLGTQLKVYQQGEAVEYEGELLGYEETLIGTAVVKSYIGDRAATLSYEGVDFSLPAVVKLK